MMEVKKGSELRGRYVISDLLGTGGFSIVWRATDKDASRDVAIKRLTKIEGNDLPRLLDEAMKTSRLKGHKNIVEVYEVFQEGDEGFLVMEYVDGDTLDNMFRKHILSRTWLERDEALDILSQTLEGLLYAHSSGVYHRDVKPSNILVSRLGTVKLVDFGLARFMAPSQEEAGEYEPGIARTGTPNFMSPEQAAGRHIDHRTDIFSAGIVGHILLTGYHPFNHPSGVAAIFELIKDPAYKCEELTDKSVPVVSAGIRTVINKMLQKDVAHRCQSLIEPLNELTREPAQACSKCGSPNPASNVYCGQCGNLLKQQIGTAVSGEQPLFNMQRSAEELTDEGFALTRFGEWEGAISKYREAIKIDSSYVRAHANLGYALNRVGSFDDAIRELSKGIEQAKDDAILHRLYDARGFARSNLKDFEGAIEDFSMSMKCNPLNPRIYYHRAESKALAGRYDGAYVDVLEALRLDPDYLRAIRLREKLEAQGYVKPFSGGKA